MAYFLQTGIRRRERLRQLEFIAAHGSIAAILSAAAELGDTAVPELVEFWVRGSCVMGEERVRS